MLVELWLLEKKTDLKVNDNLLDFKIVTQSPHSKTV